MLRAIVILGLAAATSLPLANSASADASFLSRFNGAFGGKGFVQREQDSEPRTVNCSVKGATPSSNRLDIAGSCRAAIVVSRKIGAQIRYDPSSDTFSGTYTGSSKGPAQLSNGRLRGSTLTLDLTYPTPVHGDRSAVMTIRNTGNGGFTMSVTDKVDGQSRKTSDVTLTKA